MNEQESEQSKHINDFESKLHDEKLQALLNNLGGLGNDDNNDNNNDNNNEKSNVNSSLNFEDLINYEDLEKTMVEENEEIWQARTNDNILISWHDSLHSIDAGPAIFIAHEFFDALPVNHFEYRPIGWCETLVDVDDSDDTPYHFKLIRGNIATIASAVLDKHCARYNIKPQIGEQISFSPISNEICNDISRWCTQHGGAGFIVDYGSVNPPPWTFQAAKNHKPCELVSMAGEVDISSHVNFSQLKSSIEMDNSGMKCYGPVTQSYFLQGCGIVHRFRHYISDLDNFNGNEDEKEKFIQTFGKIMDIDKLGGHFKVLGFAKESMTVPIGFREPISTKRAKTDDRGIPVYET